jgi:hypothetical protein
MPNQVQEAIIYTADKAKISAWKIGPKILKLKY